MNEAEALWRRIYAQFSFHHYPSDPDSQSAMNRVAQKCLGLSERRPFDFGNCSVRLTSLSRPMLDELQVYHGRANPYPTTEPIVVLLFKNRKVVIEGNNRVNKWKAGVDPGPWPAIFVTPFLG